MFSGFNAGTIYKILVVNPSKTPKGSPSGFFLTVPIIPLEMYTQILEDIPLGIVLDIHPGIPSKNSIPSGIP